MTYWVLNEWKDFEKITTPNCKCISKYDLLELINKVFEKNIFIEKCDKVKANKCLKGSYEVPSIEDQLKELKIFIKNEKVK